MTDNFALGNRLLAGRQPWGSVPQTLRSAVGEFKRRILSLQDGDAATRPDSGRQREVSEACTAVVDTFSSYVEQQCDDADMLAAFMFRETFPIFGASRLLERAYCKPFGYAGDYLMIEMLYNDEADGLGSIGPLIDRWALGLPASRAVKNRRPMLEGIIRELAADGPERLRVCSLASGPARELFDALAAGGGITVTATCVDIDRQALAYAEALASQAGVANQFRFVNANVAKLALGRAELELGEQDLIYSVGLIDYLGDSLVIALLDWVHDRLRPGGTVLVGNFDPANPDKPFMDHLLDWKLLHRTADDLARLFRQSRFGDTPVRVCAESTGINLFAFAERH